MNSIIYFVVGLILVVGAIALFSRAQDTRPASAPASGSESGGATFEGHVFNEDGKLIGPVTLERLDLSEEEWRERLTDEQFRILRADGTERAGTGALVHNKAEGVYTCAGCSLPLYASDAKYESGTGWPSFFRPIAPGNVAEHVDRSLGMTRTEVVCARCGGHLGHVFNDGPRPTGLRYCMNSASLAFTPATELASLAEPVATEEPGPSEDLRSGVSNPDDEAMAEGDTPLAKAVFAGGCFWCVEAVFEELEGVKEAISGYAGGEKATANYKAVSTGRTKHAEAVEIIYDPTVIPYEDLLRVHFATHDPTQLNRQGNDVGPQYRSTIFYANDEEKALAEAFIADLTEQGVFRKPIVTTLEPLTEFHEAEYYHQNYVCNNPMQGYVRAIALPKVDKVRKLFKDRLKDESPLEKK